MCNFSMFLKEKCLEVFEKSYKERIRGRKLNWMYSMGYCKMDAKFGAKSIELIVTPCQVMYAERLLSTDCIYLLMPFHMPLIFAGCIATSLQQMRQAYLF